jgi:hypothetical protein
MGHRCGSFLANSRSDLGLVSQLDYQRLAVSLDKNQLTMTSEGIRPDLSELLTGDAAFMRGLAKATAAARPIPVSPPVIKTTGLSMIISMITFNFQPGTRG